MKFPEIPAKFKKTLFVLVISSMIILFTYFDFFSNYELLLLDLRFKLRPPLKQIPQIIVIEISDSTLKKLGKWPLPRDYHASLIDVLKLYGAKMIIFDVLFSEPSLYDEIFIDSIRKARNVYLPIAFRLPSLIKKAEPPISATSIVADIQPSIKKYCNVGGHINVFVDSDGKIRKIPLFIKYKGKLYPHMALKAACKFLGLNVDKVRFKRNKVIIDDRLTLPTSKYGAFIVNYADRWVRSFKHYSYFDILKAYSDVCDGKKPQIDLEKFKGKICFIGLTATGTSDLRATPLEEIYPMVGLQANVFNSIVTRQFIKETPNSVKLIINIGVFITALLVCLYLRPLIGFFTTWAVIGGYFLISIGVFDLWGIWIPLFLPILIFIFTFLGASFYNFLKELHKRKLLENELQIARQIQASFLPQDIDNFNNLEISCIMRPAKFVAGDLYDIVILDEHRIGVLIADVSGKGVSASLIMAQTISLFRTFSAKENNPAKVLENVNQQLCAYLKGKFITALYLLIDTSKNTISACSAGHLPLVWYKFSNRKCQKVEPEGGPPLGIMKNMVYDYSQYFIDEGDKLVLYTDGVVESRNKKGEEFGIDKVVEIIENNSNSSSKECLEIINDQVDRFSKGLEQHDDITVIVIRRCR